jgi:crossover junction endodeoxyribonuclease RuvC
VLGVDPGTVATGYGVIESGRAGDRRLIECGVIRTGRAAALADKLVTLHAGIQEVLAQHAPDVMAVEGVFYAKNVRASVVLAHARGVILLAAAEAGIPVAELAPAKVKRAVVGRGRATKAQVGFMVQQLLKLRRPPSPADAADGVAIALAHVLTAAPA